MSVLTLPIEPSFGSRCAVAGCNRGGKLHPFLITLNTRCERAWATAPVCGDDLLNLNELLDLILDDSTVSREALVFQYFRYPERTINRIQARVRIHRAAQGLMPLQKQPIQLEFADQATPQGEYWRSLGLY